MLGSELSVGALGRALVGGLSVAAIVCAPASAAGKPDLRVTKLSGAAGPLVSGGKLQVVAVVSNTGTAKARASSLRFSLSRDTKTGTGDATIVTKAVKALKPKGKGTVSVTIPLGALGAGPQFVLACADATRKVSEKSERNNCRALAISVGAAPVTPVVTPVATPTATATATATATSTATPAPAVTATPTPGPPAAPVIATVLPAATANDVTPTLTGTAPAGTTVEIFKTTDCSGTVAVSGPAATFADPGLDVPVDAATITVPSATTFSARAVDASTGPSVCSNSVSYREIVDIPEMEQNDTLLQADSQADAVPLSPDVLITGVADDPDVFRFVVTRRSTVRAEGTQPDGTACTEPLSVALVGPDNMPVANPTGCVTEQLLIPGVYYVRLSAFGTVSPYGLRLTQTPLDASETEPNATSPQADFNGAITDDVRIQGTVSSNRPIDADVFRVDLAAEQTLRVRALAPDGAGCTNTDVVVELGTFQSTGADVAASDAFVAPADCAGFQRRLAAGTYYIRVRTLSGLQSYLLDLALTPPPFLAEAEPNDSAAEAAARVTLGDLPALETHSLLGGFWTRRDVDRYQMQQTAATINGSVFFAEAVAQSGSGCPASLALSGEDYRVLGWRGCIAIGRHEFDPTTGGELTVTRVGESLGAYRLDTHVLTNGVARDFDPFIRTDGQTGYDDTISTIDMPVPGFAYSSMSGTGDEDVYTFTLTKPTSLRVQLTGCVTANEGFLVIRDANREVIAFADRLPQGRCAALDGHGPNPPFPPLANLPAGTYSLSIAVPFKPFIYQLAIFTE